MGDQHARFVMYPSNSQQIGAQQFTDLEQSGKIANADAQQEQNQRHDLDMLTKFITVIAEGRGQGRMYPPAYNHHENRGMGGLIEPAALNQGTYLPLPFDDQYDKTANFMGIVNTLGTERFNMNQRIVQLAEQQQPQLKSALTQPYTIYEQYPQNFYTNRLNIELQRKREKSMYAFV